MAKAATSGLQPEILGDVDEGTAGTAATLDEMGLTPEERATFDAMKDGPADNDGPADPDPDGEPDPAQPVDPAATVPEVPPADPDGDDDETPDVVTTDPRTGKTQKTINYHKHQRLMTKAQKESETLRANAEQARLDNAKLAERLAILNEALMAPAPAPAAEAPPPNPWQEPTINPEENAIEALAQMQRRQAWSMESSTREQEQTHEQLEDNRVVQDFTRDVARLENTEEGRHFRGEDGAYQFLKNSRLVELGVTLFDKDPTDPAIQFTQAEINKMVSDYNAEEKWVVSEALNAKRSPAQAIMKLARGRGWRAPTATAATPAPVLAQTPAAAPAARPVAPAARNGASTPAPGTAVAKLQGEIEGAAASRSLSDGGGSPPGEPLTPEMLLKMNDAEFAAYVDRMPKERLDSIMGRQMPGER